MIKLYREFILAALTVLILVFGININVLADSFPIALGPNINSIDVGDINSQIDAIDPSLPDISAESWPYPITEVLEDEITDYTFDTSKTNYIFIKVGPDWYGYGVEGVDSFHWESDRHALSSYAVPDASIMWLIGTSLLLLGLLGRKTSQN